MSQTLNISRINELKNNAYDNIESYNDPDTPDALAKFTNSMKEILLADPSMLAAVPEYLPVALFNRIRFSDEAKMKWAGWIDNAVLPTWDEFKVTVQFNNADVPLVLAVRKYSEELLIESCAVVYLLNTQDNVVAPSKSFASSEGGNSDDGYDPYNNDDDSQSEDEEGYYDQYDEEER
ncbi:hypothetical protein ACFL6Z_00980 [Pseudomonadota bacterium]|uniref:cold adaptation protein AtcA n=1 Tax=unclassified Shewanella TaxID=196818 RepID=UPI000970B5CF|nr:MULTISPECIES: hypothetical protein [unclassified Shewanella]MDO6677723.1 hypothetical protein [Shewanella sp. 4_MG-2023]MDO6777086.1 hypothetical protein [Shewanella sp. 3_MG-2023]PMG29575.1 hypothetical protein BCU94_13440 [Shewanella sp. 10N.286.52.C2]PMH86776.1 hypothetical protein BCU57_09640 [Shewanella sp. 10N.286.48.B5]PMI00013.1 hypothetical protein BCU55_13270 [Shewanella sp. 10N.286.48.A6]